MAGGCRGVFVMAPGFLTAFIIELNPGTLPWFMPWRNLILDTLHVPPELELVNILGAIIVLITLWSKLDVIRTRDKA